MKIQDRVCVIKNYKSLNYFLPESSIGTIKEIHDDNVYLQFVSETEKGYCVIPKSHVRKLTNEELVNIPVSYEDLLPAALSKGSRYMITTYDKNQNKQIDYGNILNVELKENEEEDLITLSVNNVIKLFPRKLFDEIATIVLDDLEENLDELPPQVSDIKKVLPPTQFFQGQDFSTEDDMTTLILKKRNQEIEVIIKDGQISLPPFYTKDISLIISQLQTLEKILNK